MKTISRWYDVEIVFLNKKVEDTEFVGVIRKNRNLEDILINIKNFGVIKDYERKRKDGNSKIEIMRELLY